MDNYVWTDPRPPSPLNYNQLFTNSSEDLEDPLYDPESRRVNGDDDETDNEGLDTNLELEEEFMVEEDKELLYDVDNRDEEYQNSREMVRTTTSRLHC